MLGQTLACTVLAIPRLPMEHYVQAVKGWAGDAELSETDDVVTWLETQVVGIQESPWLQRSSISDPGNETNEDTPDIDFWVTSRRAVFRTELVEGRIDAIAVVSGFSTITVALRNRIISHLTLTDRIRESDLGFPSISLARLPQTMNDWSARPELHSIDFALPENGSLMVTLPLTNYDVHGFLNQFNLKMETASSLTIRRSDLQIRLFENFSMQIDGDLRGADNLKDAFTGLTKDLLDHGLLSPGEKRSELVA